MFTRTIFMALVLLALGAASAQAEPAAAPASPASPPAASTVANAVKTLQPVLAGASIYSARCAACHKANGGGVRDGMFPALAGNTLVTAADPKDVLATIAHGRNMMPSWKGQLSAADIAAVATYIRSAWGNKASPVNEVDVVAVK
jgi:mono/diheme cytochrome c family protein